MFNSDYFRPFSARSVLMLLVVSSFILQLVVLSYNHYTGFVLIDSWEELFTRLTINTTICAIAGTVIVIFNISCIRYLNRTIPWSHNILKRVSAQLSFTIASAVFISTLTTFFSNYFIHEYEENLVEVLIINGIIVVVANIMLMTVLEGWLFFNENKKTSLITGSLKYELNQVKFDVLKSQINPHFMFNSLNVLSGLIRKDTAKAQQFIEDFSSVYRYVAETIEKPLVTLNMELEFVESYLYLQKIRYGDLLSYSKNISPEILNYQLPPLSLQVILENAIKHNIINESSRLLIEIFTEDDSLVIKNRIAPKLSYEISSGTGLKNLTKRYAFVCNENPVFRKSDGYFIASLPLIN
ncbi:MAG: histidine kinase [Bacteroidales bacterium]|nr:histidine kinase [Bacteroidales bacterium]